MENSKAKRLFQEMIERKQKMKEAENFILHEEIKFKETVKDAKEELETNQKEVLKIYETPIKVGADTLVEEIAKEWGVSVENLDVDIKFVDTERFGKMGRNKFIKLCENESFNGLIRCYLNVISNNTNGYNSKSLKLPLNLLHYQRKGEMLKNWLEVKTKYKGWAPYIDFVCTDYKNLIFELTFNMLVDIHAGEFKPRNKNCELILNAYERECEKEAKNDMPSHDRHKYIQS
ncbi:MAG: hypothetical protein J6Q13_03990 [Clostridia bacterium]|nr:hypothetical protein [Clostridia bacterium]